MRTYLSLFIACLCVLTQVPVHAQDAFDELQAPPSASGALPPPAQSQQSAPMPPQPLMGPQPPLGYGAPPGMQMGPIGRVVRLRNDRVLVEVLSGMTLYVGQHVVISHDDPNDPLVRSADDQVVGEVEVLRPDGAVIRIGPNESVNVGDTAALTGRARTSTTLAPALPRNLVRLEMMTGTFLRETGVIGEATLSIHRGAGYYFVTMPSSAFFPDRTIDGTRYATNSGFQVMAGGGLQQRYVMLGLSAGLALARHDRGGPPANARAVPALGTHLRIGELDGLSFTTDLTLAVGRYFEEALYRADFGIYAPFSPRVLVGLRGGLWLTGQSYSDLHILCRIRIRGNGGDGTWFAKGAMTFLWLREVPFTTSSTYYYDQGGATLGFQVGFERRFGLGSPAPSTEL